MNTEENKDVTIILESLSRSKCDMFATYDSLKAVNDYAISLLKSSSLEEREFATMTVLNIYHNTLIQLFINNIKEQQGITEGEADAGSDNSNEQGDKQASE